VSIKSGVEIQHLRTCDYDSPKRPIKTQCLFVAEIPEKPHQSPSVENRKIGSDCSCHASEPFENCSFSDRSGTRITLPFISNLLLLFLRLGLLPSQLGLQSSVLLGQVEELPCLVEWQLLLDSVLSDDDSSLLQSSRERITGQLPEAQLRNQRLRRSVALQTAATKSAKKVMKYGKVRQTAVRWAESAKSSRKNSNKYENEISQLTVLYRLPTGFNSSLADFAAK
jgi:hypothetical protein